MRIPEPVVDYRRFRFSCMNTPEFRHLKLLLFWPLFGLAFLWLERFSPVEHYYPVRCALDDLIPFCEIFLIPYLFWFVYLIGMHIYTLLYDIRGFRRLMWYVIISYTVTALIFLFWPTCQELRPETFLRDNALTRFIAWFYRFDTHTNVTPSLHVIGSVAVWYASRHTERFRSTGWQIVFGTAAILIGVSTVFMKQHSVVDILVAIPVCAIAHYITDRRCSDDRGQHE